MNLPPMTVQQQHARAVQLLQRGLPKPAFEILAAVVRYDPRNAGALTDLGHAMLDMGDRIGARETYERAVALQPKNAAALLSLGDVCRQLGDYDASVRALKPLAEAGDREAKQALGKTYFEMGDPKTAFDWYTSAGTPTSRSDACWSLLHYDDNPVSVGAMHAQPVGQPLDAEPFDGSRPLRIGYISPNFRSHTVAKFLLPILRHHDRVDPQTREGSVHVTLYSDSEPDDVTEQIRHLGSFIDIRGLSDTQVAARIRHDQLDALIDLTGHMGGGRPRVLAMRPAPVVAGYIGYPYQLPTWDVMLDDYGYAYDVPDDLPDVSPLPADRNGHLTFGSFQRPSKLTAETLTFWNNVLSAVPSSRLVVLGDHQYVRDRVAAAGLPMDRVDFVPRKAERDYLKLIGTVDVCLDSFPYAGMTSTCDAAVMGVPTITLAGSSHVSRVGQIINQSLGLPDFIATTADDYVRAAVAASLDLPRLRHLRQTLRQTVRERMDGEQVTRQLEATLRNARASLTRQEQQAAPVALRAPVKPVAAPTPSPRKGCGCGSRKSK